MPGYKPLTIVIKLGTSSIVDEETHQPLLSILSLIVETAVKLRNYGHKVVIVSSGAIGVGLRRMDLEKRPQHLPRVQALAAVGQCRLMSLWDGLFNHVNQAVAQILLTRNDIADRTQYLNAQNTLWELLNMGVIPIVNENDTVAVSEIKFGDNDTLSAITAAMIQADYLFLMTDVDCLYDKNPRIHADAKAIEVVEDIASLEADVSTAGSTLGTGGMSTKIVAARLATSAGVTTIITRSSRPGNIARIVEHDQSLRVTPASSYAATPAYTPSAAATATAAPSLISFFIDGATAAAAASKPRAAAPTVRAPLHTRFAPDPHPIRDRSFWLLHGLAPHGTLVIDAAAHSALLSNASLPPAGIVDVHGSFAQQEAVRLVVLRKPDGSAHDGAESGGDDGAGRASPSAAAAPAPAASVAAAAAAAAAAVTGGAAGGAATVEVGRALVNYSSVEIGRIKGLASTQIPAVLGYADSEYVALRDNISFF